MDDRSTYQELKAVVLDFIRNDLSKENRRKVDEDKDAGDVVQSPESENRTTSNNNKNGWFAGWFGVDGRSASSKKRLSSSSYCRPIYLAGESFGGILASDVAMTILADERNDRFNKRKTKTGGAKNRSTTSAEDVPVNLQGLVLINPATCYDRSQLAVKGPNVAKMPSFLYLLGLTSQLLPLFTDEYSVQQLGLILQANALPSIIDNPQREAYMGRVALSLPSKLEFMPPETLSWRLEEWLQTGTAVARDSISFQSFPNFRTLIVVGERDKTLPSIAEAERLANKVMIPSQTQIHVVEGAGHASTCGSRLDLTAVMRKRFPELQTTRKKKIQKSKQIKDLQNNDDAVDGKTFYHERNDKRTSMKPEAQERYGAYFGMTDRYDKADIGLNPLQYWSKTNYRAVKGTPEERRILLPGTLQATSYKKMNYDVKKK
jgi:pimeloyl-ACP methyl ester carboxylesterase